MNTFAIEKWNIREQAGTLLCCDIQEVQAERIDQSIWVAVIDTNFFFDTSVGNVDAESICAEIEPETKRLLKISFDIWVLPVEIWLAGIKEM